ILLPVSPSAPDLFSHGRSGLCDSRGTGRKISSCDRGENHDGSSGGESRWRDILNADSGGTGQEDLRCDQPAIEGSKPAPIQVRGTSADRREQRTGSARNVPVRVGRGRGWHGNDQLQSGEGLRYSSVRDHGLRLLSVSIPYLFA
ncbi:hypothetical protein PMAYCL1PPCAC_01226, partial [Pristionchus mayeri]